MLETLKGLAPGIGRVGMMYNPDNPVGTAYLRAFEMVAGPLAVQPINLPIHDLADIERDAIASLAEQPNGGVLIPPDVTIFSLRTQVSALLARYRVPAISIYSALRQPEDWSPTVRIEPQCFANPLPTSTVFCAARNRAICHFSSQRCPDWSPPTKLPRPSPSRCPIRSSQPPPLTSSHSN